MKVAVQIMSRSGGWLRRQAAAIGFKMLMLKKDADGGAQAKVQSLDGFIVRGVRIGPRAVVKVIDPAGTIGFFVDPFNSGVSGAVSERFMVTLPRDHYSNRFDVAEKSIDKTSLDHQVPTLESLLSADGHLEDGLTDALLAWSSQPKETPEGISRVEVIASQSTPYLPFGIPDAAMFGYQLSIRKRYPGGGKRVFVSENCIADRTGGFRIAPRVAALPSASVTLPQVPFGYCRWVEGAILAALCVVKSAQPAVPAEWREDAGVGGILIVRIGFDEEGLPFWDWYHLIRFDDIDFPELSAEEWLEDWIGAAEVDPPYPVTVSGYTQNSVRHLAAAFSEDGNSMAVYFDAMFGRQEAGPVMYQQTAVAVATVSNTLEESPGVAVELMLADVVAPESSAAYAAYGASPGVCRYWTVQDAEHLASGASAFLYSTVLSRDGVRWFGPAINDFGTYQGAEPLSELSLAGGTALITSSTVGALGASMLYRWSAGQVISPASFPVRIGKLVTRIADDALLASAFSHPGLTVNPPVKLIRIEPAGISVVATLDPSQGGGSAIQQALPGLTCYQRETDDGRPYCALVSYWGDPTPYTYMTVDGGGNFLEHLTASGASHGAYYLGSTIWSPRYGEIFGGNNGNP